MAEMEPEYVLYLSNSFDMVELDMLVASMLIYATVNPSIKI